MYIDNVSKDQYAHVIFGYALAFDLVEDEKLRQQIKEDISKIIKKGVINPESIKEIDKLYEKYRFNINFANKIRNFNPNLFNLLLRIYKKIFKLVKE